MSYFPFFVEIGQKRCLVVGGGTVAFRKIEKLLPFGVEITVVSPSFCEGICRIRKEFQAEDVEDMCFVIGTTDCKAVNARIAAVCHAKHIPVNIVDDAERCSFFFPALVKRGAFVAGFSTGGASPLAARFIREQMEEAIPAGFADVIELMAAVRGRVKAAFADSGKREQVLRYIFCLALEKNGNVSQACFPPDRRKWHWRHWQRRIRPWKPKLSPSTQEGI